MQSLKDTQFWLCYFLFIVPVVKNDFFLAARFVSARSVVSVKTFDRSCNGCQVIRLGACLLLARVGFFAHYFQAQAKIKIKPTLLLAKALKVKMTLIM